MSDPLDIVARRVVEHVMTVDGLIGFFFEAAETERKLPPALRTQVRAMWPDVPADPNLAYGWHEIEMKLGPATSSEVSRYDWALAVMMLMDSDDRKIVWAAAHSQVNRERGPRWKAIAQFLHMHPETAKRRFERAVLTLWFSLVDLTGE